jgi:tRNA A-37 threonylcarbamoyl transferase component Bud32
LLGELIASGGMAQVYHAHDEFLGRDVAIKMFRSSATAEADFRKQEDEVNVLARLNHPNLITLLDAAVDRSDVSETRIYYVMELVEGTDLKRRLDEGPLVARQIAQLGYCSALALEYVHSQGIVHRDVKPANILLTFDDNGMRVGAKLGDFGVASIGPAGPISDDEVVTGTVAYLSPEQARGEEVGPASDVYALGLVLLQCFSAELAFPGPPQHSAMSRLINDPAISDAVPAEWVPLLRAMTAREPKDRPDIHDVALALRQMLAAGSGRHRAPAVRQPGDPERRKPVARYDLSTPDEAFDRITSLAARVVRAPVAILSIADHERIWVSTERDVAALMSDPRRWVRAITTDTLWIIEDAAKDPRADAHPLIAADRSLRFYAGVPLTSPEGVAIGTLCVLDVTPRTLAAEEIAALTDLSTLVVRELELRRHTIRSPDHESPLLDSVLMPQGL